MAHFCSINFNDSLLHSRRYDKTDPTSVTFDKVTAKRSRTLVFGFRKKLRSFDSGTAWHLKTLDITQDL